MFTTERTCPRCLSGQMKSWTDLTPDEKFVVERLPLSAEFSREERKRHLFCPRCWFETNQPEEKA